MIVPTGQTEVRFERRQNVVPEGGFFGRLNLRQVHHDRRAGAAQPLVIVRHVHGRVHDRGRESGATSNLNVPIVEMQAARAENLRREIELTLPVGNRLPAEEPFGPLVHLAGDILGDPHEDRARSIACLRLRWLSSDIVATWPSASSPSNIQPSAPESSAYATFRRLRSRFACGRVAGPVP